MRFLRERRRQLGLKQSDVAKETGVSPAAVSEWEREKNQPGVTVIPRLAKALKMPVARLTGKLR